MRKSLRTSALCLGLTGLMILSAGCATRNKPGTAATTPANETTGDISSSAAVADTANDGEQGVSEPDKVKLAEAPNGFVSLLNVVEFGENNFDETEITWPDTIPLGENPLVYDEGIHVVGLEDDSGISDRFNISLTADKVAALPVFGDMYYTEAEDGSRTMGYTVPYGEDASDTDNYTYASLADYEVMTRATPYNDTASVSGDASYVVFGITGAWNALPTRCDITKAGRDGRDYAYAFENGLYYSHIMPKYDLEGYPQANAVDEYAYLENKLGTPSGVAWWTAEPTTIEEFSAMTDDDREYYIIWDYKDYHMECPSDDVIASRIKGMTGCSDTVPLTQMVKCMHQIAQVCTKRGATDGNTNSMRSLANWVEAYELTGDIKATANWTVVSGATADPDTRNELRSVVANYNFS